MWEWLWNLLYPPRCVGCGTKGKQTICPKCEAWEIIPNNVHATPHRGVFQEVRGAFSYVYPLRKIIWHMKFRSKPELAAPLGSRMVDQLDPWERSVGPFNAIIPVPATRSTLRMRGFNQAELLARHVGIRWGIPVFPEYLVRTYQRAPRYKLGRVDRWKNVEHVFQVPHSKISLVRALHKILLVDDIYTTGSTAVACARALREIGVSSSSIFVATLSRVYNPRKSRHATDHSGTWDSYDAGAPGICGKEIPST